MATARTINGWAWADLSGIGDKGLCYVNKRQGNDRIECIIVGPFNWQNKIFTDFPLPSLHILFLFFYKYAANLFFSFLLFSLGGFIKDEYCSWVQYKSGPGGGPSM